MQIRQVCPYENNYYIRQATGGWNGAIQGNPTKNGANVLANCVGYANGRFAEIIGENRVPYQLVCNAENFIEKARAYGLQVVEYPTLGGIMVWQKGASLSGKDGAGHVAVVERIDGANKIYTSESAYKGSAFFNATRTNNNGRWGMGSAYRFRGCIINPAIGDVHWEEPTMQYEVGKNYITNVILKVREDANVNSKQVPYEKLTKNAQEHAYSRGANKGCLKEGTTITCLETKQDGNDIWIRIPSGWIAGFYNNKIYVK